MQSPAIFKMCWGDWCWFDLHELHSLTWHAVPKHERVTERITDVSVGLWSTNVWTCRLECSACFSGWQQGFRVYLNPKKGCSRQGSSHCLRLVRHCWGLPRCCLQVHQSHIQQVLPMLMQSCNQHRQHSAYVDCVGKLTYDGVGQKRAQIPKASKDKVTIGSWK